MALLALSLSCCDKLGGFKYESNADQFTGEEISTASESASSSTSRNSNVNLKLSCKRKIGSEPSPTNDVFIDILMTNDQGKGLDVSDVSLKLDDTAPWSYDELKAVNLSQYEYEFESSFSYIWVEKILPKEQLAILPAIAQGAANSNDNSVLDSIFEAGTNNFTKVPKSIWVRYTTSDGMTNDTTFDLNNDAVRHVLKDCGWLKDGAMQGSKSRGLPTPLAVPAPTNSASAPSSSAAPTPSPAAAPGVPVIPAAPPASAPVIQPERPQNPAPTQLAVPAPSGAKGYSAHLTGLDPNGDNYLSFRSGPGGQPYAELDRLRPDTHLTVLRSQGKWLYVRLDDGRQGWVFGRYVQADR
jgi:hypothetical protein